MTPFRMPVADAGAGSEAAEATQADKTVRRVMVVDDNRDAARSWGYRHARHGDALVALLNQSGIRSSQSSGLP